MRLFFSARAEKDTFARWAEKDKWPPAGLTRVARPLKNISLGAVCFFPPGRKETNGLRPAQEADLIKFLSWNEPLGQILELRKILSRRPFVFFRPGGKKQSHM